MFAELERGGCDSSDAVLLDMVGMEWVLRLPTVPCNLRTIQENRN